VHLKPMSSLAHNIPYGRAVVTALLNHREACNVQLQLLSSTHAVLVVEDRVNHSAHFLGGLMTFGFWWMVWFYLAINASTHRFLFEMDERVWTTITRLDPPIAVRAPNAEAATARHRASARGRLAAVFTALGMLLATLSCVTSQRIQAARSQAPPAHSCR
jgi:hypothetical protein